LTSYLSRDLNRARLTPGTVKRDGARPKAQTPLVQFVVDLLWICCTTNCTTCRKVVDLLWICCTAFRLVVDKSKAILHCFHLLSICCRVQSIQVHNILTCRDVVELLWICCTTCCTTIPQQIEQVELELNPSAHADRTTRSAYDRQKLDYSALWTWPIINVTVAWNVPVICSCQSAKSIFTLLTKRESNDTFFALHESLFVQKTFRLKFFRFEPNIGILMSSVQIWNHLYRNIANSFTR
jgi:hypothetical protein